MVSIVKQWFPIVINAPKNSTVGGQFLFFFYSFHFESDRWCGLKFMKCLQVRTWWFLGRIFFPFNFWHSCVSQNHMRTQKTWLCCFVHMQTLILPYLTVLLNERIPSCFCTYVNKISMLHHLSNPNAKSQAICTKYIDEIDSNTWKSFSM